MKLATIMVVSLWGTLLLGQSASLTVTSATLTIGGSNGDSYSLQGTFTGFPFTTSQAVLLTVGQFQSSLLVSDFVQQPGTNIFVYQDSTGQAPYWLSSLTLDLDAQTFSATASNVVLAGWTNPFAVQLGTENGLACSMARVSSADGVNFQLSSGDGVNEPCAIPFPEPSQSAFFVGESNAIDFQVTIPAASNVDSASVQLFAVDANGQPVGGPLCSLNNSASDASGNGIYTCTAQFEQDTPGAIPLMVQATAGGNTLLSPGFSVLAVGPMTQSDVDAINNVTSAATTAWNTNYQALGDTPQARMQTINAMQGMNGIYQVRLLEDGTSIGVQFTSGVHYVLFLNRLSDAVDLTSDSRTAHGNSSLPATTPMAVTASLPSPRATPQGPAQAMSTLQCNMPQRPTVKNSNVLIWNSGFFKEPTVSSIADDKFKAIKCPAFTVDNKPASIANAQLFRNYGTIVIDTHGTSWAGDEYLLTTDTVPLDLSPDDPRRRGFQIGGMFIGSPPHSGTLYWGIGAAFFRQLGTFDRTVIFAGACYSAQSPAIATILADGGGAYFGFTNETVAVNVMLPHGESYAIAAESPLLDHLLNNYMSVADAFASKDVPKTDPTVLASLAHSFHVDLSNVNAHFVLLEDPNNQLAYFGNPKIISPQGTQPSYVLGPGSLLNLRAQLDGAESCDGIMNYNWTNTGNYGHLTPSSGAGGLLDNFTSDESMTTYTARPNSIGIDNITVQFFPTLAANAAAMACTAADVNTQQVLHIVFDGQGTSQNDYQSVGNVYTSGYSASMQWHASWDVIPTKSGNFYGLDLPGGSPGSGFEPALPGTSVTGTTSAYNTNPAAPYTCSGPPVINTSHSGVTTALPQSPFLGYGPNPPVGSPIVSLWVDTFGGDDFHLCDGGFAAAGTYGQNQPPFPSWDLPSEIGMFNIDVSQWVNQPDHSAQISISGDFQTMPDDFVTDNGQTHFNGTLTLTSQTVTKNTSSMVKKAANTR